MIRLFFSLVMSLLMITSSLFAATKPIIVFDFGGVMITFDKKGMLKACAEHLRFDVNEFRSPTIRNYLIRDLAVGEMPEIKFWEKLSQKGGHPLPSNWKETFISDFKSCTLRHTEMFALVAQLKSQGYRTALLSDITEWQADAVRSMGDYDLFDPCLLSYEIGVRKPFDGAYTTLLKRLGVPAEACVFIDDRKENIEAARRFGIDGIVFESYEQLIKELKARGINTSY